MSAFVNDPDDSVVREAVKSLVDRKERRALPVLHEQLQSPRLAKRHPATVAALVRALGVLGDESSAKLLKTTLKTRGGEAWLGSSRMKGLLEQTAKTITTAKKEPQE